MDTNNWWPNPQGGETGMDTGDWRTQLQPDSRQRIVNKIMDTMKQHLPFSGEEGIIELKKIAGRFEEKIYTAATSQSDYLRKISLELLSMESKSQNAMPNTLPSNGAGNSNKPKDPGTGMQNQGQSLPIPLSANQSQARQQLLSQNIQNNMASAGVPGLSGLPSALPPSIPSVVSQNSTMQDIAGVSPNTVSSMGQGVPNLFANSQGQFQARQQVLCQQQQQQSQNQQQYVYQQQLQQQFLKQKLHQGNLSHQLLPSHIPLQHGQLPPPPQSSDVWISRSVSEPFENLRIDN